MNELLIALDTNAKNALYEQIYEHIRHDILDGRLSCGERLPSARLLASNLQVSRSTVDAAYDQLVSEGYLQAKRGSGYYVCDIGSLYDFTDILHRPDMFGTIDHEPVASEKKDVAEPEKMKYNFLPGQIDQNGFAYNAWRKCVKEAMLDLEMSHHLLLAGHPQGEYELRREISAYLYRARGVRCMPEQMMIGAGNEYLLQILGQILGNACSVAMESPTYLQAYHTFCNIGYEVRAVPMDGDGMRVEEIPGEGVSLVYVMPSHQFPLGCVMPLKRRLQLLAWAEEKPGRYIIEDDHDSEFRYKGKPIPSLQGIAQSERVIYLGTFSNSIMPSIRISYMVLPMPLVSVYHRKCGFYASTVSRMQQMAVCRFMEDGFFERHLNKMRGVYKGKRDLLLHLLKGRKWVYRIYGDHAGLHLAVELNCKSSEKEVIERAASHGILVQGITGCYIAGQRKPDENPVLLLGFGNLTYEQITDGVEALDVCMHI